MLVFSHLKEGAKGNDQWGNAGDQGEEGCEQIKRIPELAEGVS